MSSTNEEGAAKASAIGPKHVTLVTMQRLRTRKAAALIAHLVLQLHEDGLNASELAACAGSLA